MVGSRFAFCAALFPVEANTLTARMPRNARRSITDHLATAQGATCDDAMLIHGVAQHAGFRYAPSNSGFA